MNLRLHIAATCLVLAAGCSSADDSEGGTTAAASPMTPRGQAVGTAKVIVTNGGSSPLYFFREGLEVGEPYIRTRPFGQPICGDQAYERKPVVMTPVGPGATYEVTFGGIAVMSDAARSCSYFEYVAAGPYPGRVCAYEKEQYLYASLGRPSTENMPPPTRCVDLTIDVPAAGQESVTNVTLPAK